MWNDRSTAACSVLIQGVAPAARRVQRQRVCVAAEEVESPWSYRAKRGRGTIRLMPVEYRILEFLATQPNRAFTPQRIAVAVSTNSHCVTAESLRSYIASLRGQLGFFHDYIQSVPYIGYRFKA
jgi:DNA-binding response OmpR family regulator